MDWDRDPQRRPGIVRLAGEVVLGSDVPQNMAATALVTNAYLYTGEEKYRQWVLDYVEAWMERVRKNGGIMPDNVGPTGVIGENRGGQWWGGYYGWNSRFSPRIMLNGAIVGAECALLLSGDYGFLEVLRSQLNLLFDNAVSDAGGQLLLPHRYGPEGWHHFQRFRIVDAAHLWHASMERRDYELIERLRDGDRQGDWNRLDSFGEKNNREGDSEYSRFQYYDGRNPEWPAQVMRGELRYVRETTAAIRADSRDVETIVEENLNPPNPVVTKGLTQMTTGVAAQHLQRRPAAGDGAALRRRRPPPRPARRRRRLRRSARGGAGGGPAGQHGGRGTKSRPAGRRLRGAQVHRPGLRRCRGPAAGGELQAPRGAASPGDRNPPRNRAAALRQPAGLRLPVARRQDPGAV